ncbi:MAG: hypothetical protein E5Y73_17235 [Mesorhizobium sp.]|uniref:hypothetical protein n=1 Tax=Mesorhizobium sp. TaxID=1871066 RepID=UPI00121B1B8B|nr:hypothetical protein [Mesorhizobium sp.]TIL91421.1 MAG: hypothetical protein E5Y73_17235 [Mesorhizobium sp.]
MRVRTNPTVQFDNPDCDDVNMSIARDDELDVIEFGQGGDTIWIPVKDALAFANTLKAYAEELAA